MLMFKFLRIGSSSPCSFYVRNLVYCGEFVNNERNRFPIQSSLLRGYSSLAEQDSLEFAESYLVNSCGLLPETAISVAKKMNFKKPDNPDLVLTLLRDHGFNNTHISRLIRSLPGILQSDPEKNLRPKLEFFHNVMGVSKTHLGNVLCLSPYVFMASLEKRIIPCYEFLKSVLLDDKKVVVTLRRGSSILRNDVHQYIGPNLEMLRKLGAPHSVISYSLVHHPWMFNQKNDKFSAGVEEVIEMGFKPSQLSFTQALIAITLSSKSKWERNANIYKSWGWSDDDISVAFRKNPSCMLYSEKKISSAMEFLVNKMGFSTSAIVKNPTILCYSLEKRIVPRSRVYKVLQLKGLMEKEIVLFCFIVPAEKRFLDRFVSPYIEQVPQLLDIYKGNIGFSELEF